MSVPIPAKLLKKGRNLVKVMNTTPDKLEDVEKPKDMAYENQQPLQQNYYWGWLAISEMRLQLSGTPAPDRK